MTATTEKPKQKI